tara:strand:- start:1710 stop:1904 length:195 start_codon:yes stop_codon:yes gene_type:complete
MLRVLTLLISGPICILLAVAGLNWLGWTVNLSFNPLLAGTLIGILSMLMAHAASSLVGDLTNDQ